MKIGHLLASHEWVERTRFEESHLHIYNGVLPYMTILDKDHTWPYITIHYHTEPLISYSLPQISLHWAAYAARSKRQPFNQACLFYILVFFSRDKSLSAKRFDRNKFLNYNKSTLYYSFSIVLLKVNYWKNVMSSHFEKKLHYCIMNFDAESIIIDISFVNSYFWYSHILITCEKSGKYWKKLQGALKL